MTAPTDAPDPRDEPDTTGDEFSMLTGFLDHQRATFAMKIAGFEAEALRQRALPPSDLSLVGLARHLAEVERSWMRRCLAGEDAPPLTYSPDDPDGDFAVDGLRDERVAADLAWLAREQQHSRELVAGRSVEEVVTDHRGPRSVRWILVHLIEEYARHNGHADLLAQKLDGRTGE
ncbi:DinB family protein [Kineococcus gynurae]|uniref:DinB family protein n=1 Tax=Kineococcus gynurae TaxID=452979 RepID=A0ABV5LVI6_9ACTN